MIPDHGEPAQRVGDGPVALHGGVLLDQRGPRGRVAHAVHQLSQSRTGLRGEGVPRVPQIMKVEASELGCADRLAPCPGEVRPPELGALGADEHQALIPLPRVRVQVRAGIRQEEFRHRDDALAGVKPGLPLLRLPAAAPRSGRRHTGWTQGG